MALICDVCKVRPAQARITFLRNGQPRVIDVCGEDYAALQANPQFAGALPSEEFGRLATQQEINIAELLSEGAALTLQQAAENAISFGSPKIENPHLLIALSKNEIAQKILQ